ncbi:TraR/DksA C4-type zinc finger protein [Patescibacteria group bacterium]|nr:TraR/DksA C4-type zinc finger protein [Patescibacteria group bacterium]
MSLDQKTLDELKISLLKEQAELEKNLEQIAKPLDKKGGDYETNFEEIGTGKEDNATEIEQYSDNFSVEVILEKKLQNIIEALQKVEEGTYGICEKCQQEIDLNRLKASPSAKNCLKCAQ